MTVLVRPHQRSHHYRVLFPGRFYWGDSEMKHFKTLLLSCWVLGFHQITQGDMEYHLITEGPFLPSFELEDRRDFFWTPTVCVEKKTQEKKTDLPGKKNAVHKMNIMNVFGCWVLTLCREAVTTGDLGLAGLTALERSTFLHK